MLTIEPLRKDHALSMVFRDDQKDEVVFLMSALLGQNHEHAFCFLNDGEPVLIIGLCENWKKVFGSYTFFSKSWHPSFMITVVKASKKYLKNLEYDRIEHLVSCGRPWTDKMARLFGFRYVATLEKYINGENYKLYEIVNVRS